MLISGSDGFVVWAASGEGLELSPAECPGGVWQYDVAVDQRGQVGRLGGVIHRLVLLGSVGVGTDAFDPFLQLWGCGTCRSL
jgi:hypothetical protein